MISPRSQRTLVLALIAVGILLAGVFGFRALRAFREFRKHGPPPLEAVFTEQVVETDVELIRDWMTIPYISKTYQVNPRILFEALEIPPRGNEEKSLLQLNEEYYPDQPGMVIELVKAAVRAHQSVPTAVSPEINHPPVEPIGPIPP